VLLAPRFSGSMAHARAGLRAVAILVVTTVTTVHGFNHIAVQSHRAPTAAVGAVDRLAVRATTAAMAQHGGVDLFDWLETQLAKRRVRIQRPERIILVRHGQSEGNTDRTAYSSTPDSQIALTERGWAQGVVAGLQIRKLVGDESVRFFYSPYMRARQTLLAILQAFDTRTVQMSAEPRLREQDFGNFQDPAGMDQQMKERQQFGRFYFRFPNGEAGTDVFDRMASFITYLFRTMGEKGTWETPEGAKNKQTASNYVLVTHGLLMRIFCMCYLRWTVTEFEQVWNPSNCEIWVLQKVPGNGGTYELAGRWRASPYGGSFVDIPFGKSKKEGMHEHMKRPLVSRLVTPGNPNALDGVELAHLRDLPGPRRSEGRDPERNKMMLAVDQVLAYWSKDSKRASVSSTLWSSGGSSGGRSGGRSGGSSGGRSSGRSSERSSEDSADEVPL